MLFLNLLCKLFYQTYYNNTKFKKYNIIHGLKCNYNNINKSKIYFKFLVSYDNLTLDFY